MDSSLGLSKAAPCPASGLHKHRVYLVWLVGCFNQMPKLGCSTVPRSLRKALSADSNCPKPRGRARPDRKPQQTLADPGTRGRVELCLGQPGCLRQPCSTRTPHGHPISPKARRFGHEAASTSSEGTPKESPRRQRAKQVGRSARVAGCRTPIPSCRHHGDLTADLEEEEREEGESAL